MALLHRSSDTSTDSSDTTTDVPVTDVMASNEVVTSTEETPTRDTQYTGTPVVQSDVQVSDVQVPVASFGIAVAVFLALLVSAWAGIVPFIGPTFGFSADGTSSWTWNEVHALGALAPGAVGVFVCLLMFASIRQPLALRTWGFVLFLCGAWLAVVPVVWPVLVGTYFHAASPSMTLAHWLGYASGPGVLLAAFGAFVMGRAGHRFASNQTAPL
jgi:hypothetical protein